MVYIVDRSIGLPRASHTIDLPTQFTIISVPASQKHLVLLLSFRKPNYFSSFWQWSRFSFWWAFTQVGCLITALHEIVMCRLPGVGIAVRYRGHVCLHVSFGGCLSPLSKFLLPYLQTGFISISSIAVFSGKYHSQNPRKMKVVENGWLKS